MDTSIINLLENELSSNNEIIAKATANLKNAPEGKLKISIVRNKYPQYYWYRKRFKKTEPNGKYIKKKDIAIAAKLAQKGYDLETIAVCKKQNSIIEKLLKALVENDYSKYFDSISIYRKNLIYPWHVSEKELIEKWYKEHPGYMNSMPVSDVNMTSDGMIMRSKSEVIIAEILKKLDIPFVYEPEVYINNRFKYPDFALFCIKERKTIYYEHFGMMDNQEYAEANISKLNSLINDGFTVGDDLLVSFETSVSHINAQAIEKMLRKRFGLV